MNHYFPFIYEKKKREREPAPLYIELEPPRPQNPEKIKEDKYEITIIELF
jgi:hypothetical protein